MKSPKKDNTYQPQFAYKDSEDNKEPLIFSETEATPNESLFIQWCNEQRSAKLPIGFNGGCLTALGCMLLIKAVKIILSPKASLRKFKHYNNLTVENSNNSWVCPCCKLENIGHNHCERCGVLPKFKQLRGCLVWTAPICFIY